MVRNKIGPVETLFIILEKGFLIVNQYKNQSPLGAKMVACPRRRPDDFDQMESVLELLKNNLINNPLPKKNNIYV